MARASYGLHKRVEGELSAVREAVIAALKTQGFGVLTEIDIAATLKKKIDKNIRPYVILGACNPPIAAKAIEVEADIGLLLPCNVLLQVNEPSTVDVSMIDPAAMFKLVDADGVEALADEVTTRLQGALDAL